MKAYSEDLRRKVVEALKRGLNKSEAACLFGVSLSSVKRYASLAREGHPLKPGKAPGKRPKIDERGRRLLEADLKQRPVNLFVGRLGTGPEEVGVYGVVEQEGVLRHVSDLAPPGPYPRGV
jgi:transposase